MVLGGSADDSTPSSRLCDSAAGTTCSNTKSSATEAAGSLISSTPLDGDTGGGESSDRHEPLRWMRPEVVAAIRNIHNTKKATIKQHY